MKSSFYAATFFAVLYCLCSLSSAEEIFPGEKSSWHGFDRYDFVLDEATLEITPFKAPDREGDGVSAPGAGKRRCIIVLPNRFAENRPWSWRGCYWNHEPQTEIELLKRGIGISHVTGSPGKEWEAWHAFLTKHGFSQKPAFIGMSRGGEYSYTWSVRHPDMVSCIYADNPGCNPEVFSKLADLAAKNVPILHVNGSIDPLLARVSNTLEQMYRQFGGCISIVIKEGAGHHPHSLRNPKLIADFIEKSIQEKTPVAPDFVGQRFTRSNYYSTKNLYREFPGERTFMTLRGPEFTPNYERYEFFLPEVEGSVTIVLPRRSASGKPWLLRADFLDRDATVDQLLLDKGVAIVTGAIPYNADGPKLADWNRIYQHLTQHGFSQKPILAGAGGAAAEAFGWAIANPDKVACLYAENPVLRHSYILSKPVLENLAPLAEADVPVFCVCGNQEPRLVKQIEELQKRYSQSNGQITVVFEEKGRYPNAPRQPEIAVDDLMEQITVPKSFHMDESGISREALENYLDRSVTMTELLTVDPFGVDGPYPGKDDDLRLIENVGAKFIGRAIYRWGREDILNNTEFLDNAKKLASRIHEMDSEIVLQGCLFEIVTQSVDNIPVPTWAFEAIGLPPEDRNFRYEKMLSPNGKFVNHWGRSSVPDITQQETQLWFIFLAGTYFDVGCEALHLGQTALLGMNDPTLEHWDAFCKKLRTFAKDKTRRGWVLLDAHTPKGGMVYQGKSILDFNSFPLRIKEIPDTPLEGVLEVGYLDSLFLRSHGGVAPSGWACDSLPFLVEFDNFGRSRNAGQPTLDTHFIWGYDEISWLYQLDEERRNGWLKYAADWIRETDPNAHLQMPVSRVLSIGQGGERKFRANTRSDAVPNGLNLEETIKELLERF